MNVRSARKFLVDLFNDEDPPGELVYDPVHVAGVLVACMMILGSLFWLLWALLVCEGGLFSKALPFVQAVFTRKTFADFGYRGHPHELGAFEGWIVNATALALAAAALAGIWWVLESKERKR